ncbi:MAG: prepilin-type N-terminal cleavage/methylation domain-containing protein [bacterium]|nr:prepilin-type N-terminal cleavage/methylation domain-containing protein [Candidatus Sumerlaeota bacterium]
MTRQHNGRAGFTLLELMVVIVMIMILTLMAIGSYANFRKSRRIRSAAENVNSAFVAARSYAIANDKWYRVVFQLKNPQTGAAQYAVWIDEIQRNTSRPPNPANATINDGVTRPKITTPEFLPEAVAVTGAVINNGVDPVFTLTSDGNNYFLVRFMPDGSSDQASIYLWDTQSPSATPLTPPPHSYYTVKLYAPTARSHIYPETRN